MDPVDSQCITVEPPPGTKYLTHGFAAHIYVTLDSDYVIKRPKEFEDDESLDFRGLVDNEREIYDRIGNHDGVIGYHGYDQKSGSIKLVCASDGDLTDFIKNKPKPDQKMRSKMMRHISNTLLYFYSHNVAIQDIKTDNVLMHRGIPKLCDFTQGIRYPLTEKMQDVCPEEVLGRDLLGIGCVLYSISTWKVFNYDFDNERRWPTSDDLESTENVQFGKIIENCWHRKYSSIEDFHNDITGVETE
ncbi:serine/threonine protein kinase [Exophiala aquamarina CBS 119918]|uniref:Serine/threonine protein kinase n=1 Tax=Exophiala aquamarina CBS 119918 TaxID=1182545 RepID=A0A072P7B7_9EURO|nr:serine/threonine protein kinase [Exophiala aquamarina CBS 119918]KEF55617.1 serine/threonine protein kinase [Exophiala aquamarina CBS 119918]